MGFALAEMKQKERAVKLAWPYLSLVDNKAHVYLTTEDDDCSAPPPPGAQFNSFVEIPIDFSTEFL